MFAAILFLVILFLVILLLVIAGALVGEERGVPPLGGKLLPAISVGVLVVPGFILMLLVKEGIASGKGFVSLLAPIEVVILRSCAAALKISEEEAARSATGVLIV